MKLFPVTYFTLTTFFASVTSQDVLCNDDDVLTIFNDVAFENPNVLGFDAGVRCIAEVDRFQCAADIIANETGISSECSSCFAAFTDCAQLLCFDVCRLQALDQEACEICVDASGCEFGLERCVGQTNLFQDEQVDACLDSPDTETFAFGSFFFVELPFLAGQAFDRCSDFEANSSEAFFCRKDDLFEIFGGDISDDCLSCVETHAACIANEGCSEACQTGDVAFCADCVNNTICADEFTQCSGFERYGLPGNITQSPTPFYTDYYYEEENEYEFYEYEEQVDEDRFIAVTSAFISTLFGTFAALCGS